MLRIITGLAKNKRLKTPDIPNYRAVQEVMRGAVFSILGDTIQDKKCLDLFAGSGCVGLEALSRGAAYCDFVDESKQATDAIKANIINCGFTDKTEVFHKEVVKFTGNTERKYDIIFVDPFYSDTHHVFLVRTLAEILNSQGCIFFFHGKQLDMNKILKETELKILETRRFGNSYVDILGLV